MRIHHFESLKTFLHSLITSSYTIDDETNLWTNKSKWLHCEEIFLYRDCYKKYIQDMFSTDKKSIHLMRGTPGIGKSTFLNAVFIKIIDVWKENPKKLTIFYQDKGKSNYIQIDSDGKLNIDIVSVGFQPSCDYHLADSVDITSISSPFTLLVSFPMGNNFNTYTKLIEQNSRKDRINIDSYMPLFSYDELSLISPPE